MLLVDLNYNFECDWFVELSDNKLSYNNLASEIGPLHMSPVDRAGSVTEMKLVSVHMVTFSPLSELKILKKW